MAVLAAAPSPPECSGWLASVYAHNPHAQDAENNHHNFNPTPYLLQLPQPRSQPSNTHSTHPTTHPPNQQVVAEVRAELSRVERSLSTISTRVDDLDASGACAGARLADLQASVGELKAEAAASVFRTPFRARGTTPAARPADSDASSDAPVTPQQLGGTGSNGVQLVLGVVGRAPSRGEGGREATGSGASVVGRGPLGGGKPTSAKTMFKRMMHKLGKLTA